MGHEIESSELEPEYDVESSSEGAPSEIAFDENWYLSRYPGAAAAVRAPGSKLRAIDHFLQHGREKGWLPVPPLPSELVNAHNRAGYLSPTDLSKTPVQLRRIALVGSCNMKSWQLGRFSGCPVDLITLNHADSLPEMGVDVSAYDFAVVQIPLREAVPDLTFCRLAHEKHAYEQALDEATRKLDFLLDQRLKWNEQLGLLTFVANFFSPQSNAMGLLFPRYDIRNPEYFVQKLNERLEEMVLRRRNAYLLDADRIVASLGRRYWQDDSLIYTTHNSLFPQIKPNTQRMEYVPGSSEYHHFDRGREPGGHLGAAIWSQLVTMLRVLRQSDAVKLVVVDLDDTLWNGVVGDLAEPDPSMISGWPFGLLEALLFLKKRGVLLAIVSKNEESRIREIWPRIFRNKLQFSDFAAVKINWQPKAENMREILDTVSLLPRSVVFVDDNPGERAAMQLAFPEIRVLGRHPYLLRRTLLWSSETQVPVITEESAKRTEMVQAQLERESSKKTLSRADFLASAAPNVTCFWIRDVGHARFARAFELLNKTNQFNTTGKRWKQEEVADFFASGGAFLAFEVTDTFTSYGLVGVVLVSQARIVQWVMSCRILGYDIENAVMAQITQAIRRERPSEIAGALIETEANFPCRSLFSKTGFEQHGNEWVLPTGSQLEVPAHVRITGAL